MSICDDVKKVYPEIVPELTEFYGCIDGWTNIYKNYPPWRTVKKSGLYASGERSMSLLGTAKVLTDEFAKLTFSEQINITISDDNVQRFVLDVLNKNGFWKSISGFLSGAFAVGGGAIKVFADKGKVCIDYIDGSLFIPTAWNSKDITEGIFCSQISKNKNFYRLYERHYFNANNSPCVEHKLYKSSMKAQQGSPCALSELFPDLPETVVYNNGGIQMFQYFKPDVSNNIDTACPLGISIFSGAVDTLKALDVAFDSFAREFVLGKKRIIVPSSCIQTVVDVNSGELKRYFDADDEAYVALKCDEEKDLKITDNTIALRIEEHVSAINALLNILCFQVGLSAGSLSFDAAQGIKTATEVISQDSKTARTAKANKNLIAELIEGVVHSIISLGVGLNLISNTDYEIQITMPDGVVIDDNTRIENNIKLVSAGLRSSVDAIMDIDGCDESTAIKKLEQIHKEQSVSADMIDLLSFGDDA